jgi:hypothetical protein
MNTELLKRVRSNFSCNSMSRATQRIYIRKWCVSVRHLGPKWLLAKPINQSLNQPTVKP